MTDPAFRDARPGPPAPPSLPAAGDLPDGAEIGALIRHVPGKRRIHAGRWQGRDAVFRLATPETAAMQADIKFQIDAERAPRGPGKLAILVQTVWRVDQPLDVSSRFGAICRQLVKIGFCGCNGQGLSQKLIRIRHVPAQRTEHGLVECHQPVSFGAVPNMGYEGQ